MLLRTWRNPVDAQRRERCCWRFKSSRPHFSASGRLDSGAWLQPTSDRLDSGAVLQICRSGATGRRAEFKTPLFVGSIPTFGIYRGRASAQLGLISPARWERYPGPQSNMGRWARGQAAVLSKLKSRVRIPHALLNYGSVA